MRLLIAAVGKLKAGPERDLYDRYVGRAEAAGRTVSIGPVTTLEIGESRRGTADERRAEECQALLGKLPGPAVLVALDEKGEALSSEGVSALLAKHRDAGASCMAFLIGGPDGHGAGVREKAARTISLGAITLPHGLARVVMSEQLYRAVTILTGHPYHRG